MRKVHFTLQGKGGVGKSWVSCQIAQYLMDRGGPVVCLDTDPVNATLSTHKALCAEHVEMTDEASNTINTRAFDQVVERFLKEDSDFVLDNGASSFLPLSNYLIENPVFDMVAESGKATFLHTVITGGQAFDETVFGFGDLANEMPETVGFIVWINEYFGRVEDSKGIPFEETKAYLSNKHRVTGLVRLPRMTADTFGTDVKAMAERKWTYKEALDSPVFSLMARQRLKKVRQGVYDQLDKLI